MHKNCKPNPIPTLALSLLPSPQTALKLLRFIRRQTVDGAGEETRGDSGRQFLVISQKNDVRLNQSHRNKKIFRITEYAMHGRKRFLQQTFTLFFRLLRQMPLETQNVAIARNDDENLSARERLFKQKPMSRMQPIERPKYEDTHTPDVITS